jgi:hypothetical protein
MLFATKLRLFVGNARGVLGVDFQENTLNGSRDTDVNVLSSSCKVPLITGRSQNTNICRHSAYDARCGF